MYKLSFTLKQHTPLVHFQHYHEGATLRVTEVKPKLDRFIIEKLGGWYNVPSEWKQKVNDAPKRPLKYKVSIEPIKNIWVDYIEQPKESSNKAKTNPYPSYFGNMGRNYTKENELKKFVFTDEPLHVSLIIPDINFYNYLTHDNKDILTEFFFKHNFGNRQTKGFGSFFLADANQINGEWYNYKFEISISEVNFREKFRRVFACLDFFYRSLRAGINLKDRNKRDGFYFKSLLFMYCKEKYGIQWEKRTIKETWFLKDSRDRNGNLVKGLEAQITERALTGDHQSAYTSQNKKIIKDVLGLSSEESWHSYSSTIKKDHTTSIKENLIERYRSPITFKVIQSSSNPEKYSVYLLFDDLLNINNEWFIFKTKGNKDILLQVVNDFKISDFFIWLTDKTKFNFDAHVGDNSTFKNFQDRDRNNIYSILQNIYSQLQNG